MQSAPNYIKVFLHIIPGTKKEKRSESKVTEGRGVYPVNINESGVTFRKNIYCKRFVGNQKKKKKEKSMKSSFKSQSRLFNNQTVCPSPNRQHLSSTPVIHCPLHTNANRISSSIPPFYGCHQSLTQSSQQPSH